jgi:tetratricopeptide (TPR) repeat protein
LVVTYTDAVHLYGDEPRTSEARIKVSGSVNSGVTADQYVVFEELLKARKGSVEAEALAGLGGIYKDMGLDQRAALRAKEALGKVDPIIISRKKLPGDLVENAFKLKWESELLQDDFDAATATCLAFNRLYPESVLADQALMTLGRSLADRGDYEQAVDVYGRVLKLENPISGAEAQFRIGEALQKQAEEMAEAADEHNSKWGRAGLSKDRPAEPHGRRDRRLPQDLRDLPGKLLRRRGARPGGAPLRRHRGLRPGRRPVGKRLRRLPGRGLPRRDAAALGQRRIQDGRSRHIKGQVATSHF